jgi:hypothetical protein
LAKKTTNSYEYTLMTAKSFLTTDYTDITDGRGSGVLSLKYQF